MNNQPYTTDDIQTPVMLMCAPFTMSNRVRNNVLMKENPGQINYNKLFKQFLELYNFIAGKALVYLLPHDGNFQDQVFTANGGIVLPHTEEPTIVLSNFTSPPRWDEEKVYDTFFTQLKYNVVKCPYRFEGEADMKWIRANKFIAGYGIRSELRSFYWMEEKFGCDILPVEMTQQSNYHFDCILFTLSEDRSLVITSLLKREDIKKIEKLVDIVDVPAKFAQCGMTNLVRVGDCLIFDPVCKKHSTQEHDEWFGRMCRQQGLTPKYIDLSEMGKNGGDTSCCVLHINRCLYKSNPIVNVNNQVKNFYNYVRNV